MPDLLGDIFGEDDADLSDLNGEGGDFLGEGPDLSAAEECLAGEEDSLEEDKGEDLVGVDDLALNGGDTALDGVAALGNGEVADLTGEETEFICATADSAVWMSRLWGVPLQEDSSHGSKGSSV